MNQPRDTSIPGQPKYGSIEWVLARREKRLAEWKRSLPSPAPKPEPSLEERHQAAVARLRSLQAKRGPLRRELTDLAAEIRSGLDPPQSRISKQHRYAKMESQLQGLWLDIQSAEAREKALRPPGVRFAKSVQKTLSIIGAVLLVMLFLATGIPAG